jgi:acetyl-CoA carboxylase biotin carboxyl carrier protein
VTDETRVAPAQAALDGLCRTAASLVHVGATPPRRVRVQQGDLLVDIEWADGESVSAAAVATPIAEPRPEAVADEDSYLRSPTVGTFYRAPEPGQAPFVSVGDQVEPGQQVGILETMKLMNPVEVDCAGRVAEILVADGASVEYDQPLLRIDRQDA